MVLVAVVRERGAWRTPRVWVVAWEEAFGQDIFWSKPAPASKDARKELVGALVKRRGEGGKKEKGEKGGEGEKGVPVPINQYRVCQKLG